MSNLTIYRGLPASGKSTLAQTNVAAQSVSTVRVNRDDTRFMMFGAYVLAPWQEDLVTIAMHNQVKGLLATGIDVHNDDTNLRAQTVKGWYDVADQAGATVSFIDVETDVDECVRRANARTAGGGREVPEHVIRGMYARYFRKGKLPAVPERPKGLAVEPYANDDESLPRAILVDLDGTIAKNNSGRGFYDWERVGEDDLVEAVRYVVRLFKDSGVTPIFMSGRDAVCRNHTVRWLFSIAGFAVDQTNTHLHMRPQGSMEPDDKVKLALFNEHIRGKYRVVAVFDDRISVCRLWHALGLPLFRVGDPEAIF